jgi:hypothetical protein
LSCRFTTEGICPLRFSDDLETTYWSQIEEAGGWHRPQRPPYRPWLFDPLAVGFDAPPGEWAEPYLWPELINFDGPAIIVPPGRPRMIETIASTPFRRARVAQPQGGKLVIPWGPIEVIYGGVRPPDHHVSIEIEDNTFYIPIRWAYFMRHSVDLLLMPEETSCAVISMSISSSMSSTAATLQATISGSGWADALSSESPRIVRAIINGWVHDFVVDTWTESRSFGQHSLSLTARARSILLGDRFWLPQSTVQTEARFMSQLAEECLPDDWLSVWSHTDWNVPGGLWSYTNTKPLQALAQLAQSSGAFVLSDPTTNKVTIKPVYANLPWDYGSAGVDDDLEIPEEAIVSLSRASSYEDAANRIVISGSDSNGVLIQATVRGNGRRPAVASSLRPADGPTLMRLEPGRSES